jgi:pimeloyl-ACP methyl ester carboxylesterase
MHTNLPNLMRVAAVMLVKLALCIALAASATFGDTTYCWNRIFPGAYTDVVFALTTYAVPPDSDPFWCESLLGELPAALCFEHTVSEVNPPATTYFCHTGMIHGVVAPPDLYKEAEYSITYGSYSPSSPWMQHRVYLTQIDDYADEPHDTNHIVALALQETWSTTQGFVNGHLHAAKHWHVMDVPADMDVFRVDCSAGVYCIETGLTDGLRPHQPLDITVYRKQAHSDAYDGNPIAWTNAFCIYNDNGEIDATHQRVYFTLTDNHGAYVRIASATASACSYHLRLFRARPIILVHGIDCKPCTQNDARKGNNALGNWEDCLPWDRDAYPCWCYNFAWNSERRADNLSHDGEGKLRGIIEQDPGEPDNPNVGNLQRNHGMDVVLIGHSMGGFFVRFALKDDDIRDSIYKAVLLGSPMYGSDIALGSVSTPVTMWKNTTSHNLRMLRRGSVFVTTMDSWEGKEKCICIAGTGTPPRVTCRFNVIPYDRGLWHGDGVVPVSSALLRDAHNYKFLRNHGTVALASYAKENEYVVDPTPASPGLLSSSYNWTSRRNKHAMFTDKLYRCVRNQIR